ncbi:hypothetical protein E4K72_19485 [Oxalobacteraceae bacterium OM1]|nr:hypothetical protein E4K72_19485 [Oxalobacteraceae bacterium OM1]
MFAALQKSKQLYIITLDRIGDYLDLLRVELKIREQQVAIKIAGFAVAALFALLATVFLGVAIIVSFWDSPHRGLAAWFVVLLYGGIAGAAIYMATKRFTSPPLSSTIRNELQRDIAVIRESL